MTRISFTEFVTRVNEAVRDHASLSGAPMCNGVYCEECPFNLPQHIEKCPENRYEIAVEKMIQEQLDKI